MGNKIWFWVLFDRCILQNAVDAKFFCRFFVDLRHFRWFSITIIMKAHARSLSIIPNWSIDRYSTTRN